VKNVYKTTNGGYLNNKDDYNNQIHNYLDEDIDTNI